MKPMVAPGVSPIGFLIRWLFSEPHDPVAQPAKTRAVVMPAAQVCFLALLVILVVAPVYHRSVSLPCLF